MKASGERAAKAAIEALRQHRLHAVLLQQPELGRRQGEPERAGVGHEEAARMRLEGQRHHRRVQHLGVLGGALEQGLVAAMHAVEIAQRHGPALPLRGRRLPLVEGRDHMPGVAPRHQHGRLAVDHDLVAVEALGLEGHAAALVVDRGDGGDRRDGVADRAPAP